MAATRDQTRSFAAGGFRFAAVVSDPSDRPLIESLFADLPVASQPLVGVYELNRVGSENDPRWLIDGPRLEDQPELPLASLLSRLMSAVNLSALDVEPDSLHLHAAAATRNGRAVVIAAERNTGKTTTVVHLVERGWVFITDEAVRLPPDDEAIRGFPKPVSIKPDGLEHVAHLAEWMVPPIDDGLTSFRFVPIGATGATTATSAVPAAVVLLRRPEGSGAAEAVRSTMLHPADAVVALMQETLDAARFGAAAERLARLVAGAPCYEVTVGTPAETAAHIESLVDESSAEPCDVVVIPAGSAIAEQVVSVNVGGRVVVHHLATGRIFALDDVGSRIWEQLAGWRDHSIDLGGPGVASFVSQLGSLEVLAHRRAEP